jgi:hypothetical protein
MKSIEQFDVNVEFGIDTMYHVTGQMIVRSINPALSWKFYLMGVLSN